MSNSLRSLYVRLAPRCLHDPVFLMQVLTIRRGAAEVTDLTSQLSDCEADSFENQESLCKARSSSKS